MLMLMTKGCSLLSNYIFNWDLIHTRLYIHYKELQEKEDKDENNAGKLIMKSSKTEGTY